MCINSCTSSKELTSRCKRFHGRVSGFRCSVHDVLRVASMARLSHYAAQGIHNMARACGSQRILLYLCLVSETILDLLRIQLEQPLASTLLLHRSHDDS